MTTVLVVDDRAINREFLVTLLSYSNYQTLEAIDGANAYQMIKNQHPDLIITDIAMPVMSGYDLVLKLQDDPETKNIPVIFYTATYRLEDAALIAMKCGVKYVLSKPSDPELILETVKKALPESAKETTTNDTNDTDTARGENLSKDNIAALVKPRNTSALTPNQLTILTSRLYTMMELSLDLLSERDPKKLIALFCKGSRKIMGTKYCVLGIFQEDSSKLKYYYISGVDSIQKTNMVFPSTNNGLISQLLKTRTPLKLNNIRDQAATELPPNHPTELNFLGFPVLTASQLYGFLYFVDKLDHSIFNEVDVEIIITLSSQIAVLYENIKLQGEFV